MGPLHPHWHLPLLLITEEPFREVNLQSKLTCYCPFHPVSPKLKMFLGSQTFTRSSVLKYHLCKPDQNCRDNFAPEETSL